jgi:hypothetical protein
MTRDFPDAEHGWCYQSLEPSWLVPTYFKPAIDKGEVVAVVDDAKTEKAVSNATVEILTLNNAVVATVNSDFFGKASSTLEEFRIRVKHPNSAPRSATCRWYPARL